MTTSLQEQFLKDKDKLLALTSRFSAAFKNASNQNKIEQIIENLESETFRLVILGQFKRGKSTLINALLGKRILPADVIPVTAIVTEIAYGPKREAQVYFYEGAPLTIDPERLPEFVTEEANPKNIKKVDRVKLTCPAPFLSHGVILVDTPGIGSIHEHNTRLTQEYIPNADAVVFVFSADPPLTEQEKAFIELVQPHVPKIFFVLNKKDYLDTTSLQRVLSFNTRILENILPDASPSILPVSALQGLNLYEGNGNESDDSSIPALRDHLEVFLAKERGSYLLRANLDRLSELCVANKNLIRMEQQARSLSQEELQNSLERFKQYIREISGKETRLQFLLEEIQKRLIAAFDQRRNTFVRQTALTLQQHLYTHIDKIKHLAKTKLRTALEEELNHKMIDIFEPFRLEEERLIRRQYQDELRALNAEVSEIVNETYRFSAQLLGLHNSTNLPQEDWKLQSMFSYKTWEPEVTLDILENRVLTLLPRPLFLMRQKQVLKRLALQKLEQQSGRLRADLLYRFQDSNRHFLFEFQQTMQRIQNNISRLIEHLLEEKRTGKERLKQEEQAAQEKLQTLKNILKKIEVIQKGWLIS